MSLFSSTALAGKRALVTGSSRGIGAAIATLFADIGAEVVLASNDNDGMQKVAAEIERRGGRASVQYADLLQNDGAQVLANAAGNIDILVNNAAPDQQMMPLLDSPRDLWERMFALNMWTPLALMRHFGAQMAQRGGGSIINISSISARNPAPGVAPYAASKAALEVITRTLALELGHRNVRCNCIAPSLVNTRRVRSVTENPAYLERVIDGIPLHRLAQPSDMASVAAWLASDASGFVTGQVITVDGGGSGAPPVPKNG